MSRLKLHNFPSYIDDVNTFEFNEVDMGESSISFSIYLDAKIDPNFELDWAVEYEDKLFILDSLQPSGVKDTSSMRYKYSLIFKDEVSELKRYPFQNMVTLDDGDVLPNTSTFAFQGSIQEFIDRFNLNLKYYLGDRWVMTYSSTNPMPTESVTVSVNNSSLWDMLTQVFDLYNLRWITDSHTIKIGGVSPEVEHIFEYGKKKGLYSIERVNPNDDIYTRLIGVGSRTNMPSTYFKTNDPDTNDIIKSMHFTGIVPKQYRDYIRGWNAKSENINETPAYNQGAIDATSGKKMQPIDYAEHNTEKWGIRYGSIQPNDKIYPTIQGVEVDGLGRIDEVIAVEQVTDDDWEASAEGGGVIQTIPNAKKNYLVGDDVDYASNVFTDYFNITDANNFITLRFSTYATTEDGGHPDGINNAVSTQKSISLYDTNNNIVNANIKVNKDAYTITNIPAGKYRIFGQLVSSYSGDYGDKINMAFELTSIKVISPTAEGFSDYFNVWIKDIGFDLRDPQYWTPERMVMMFSDGLLAGDDYEFELVAEESANGELTPRIFEDNSKEYNGVKSKYRIQLKKSDAELEASGKYLPNIMQNAKSGDHFFLINIALPHSYILNAEKRVSDWLDAEVIKSSDESPTYTIKPSSIFMADFVEANKMVSGSKLRVRDERLVGDSYLPIYIQSRIVSYRGDKMLPDYNIVVSDNVIAAKSPIQLLQSSIDKLSMGGLSQDQITDMSRQFERFFLRKDGMADISYSPTIFNQDVSYGGLIKSTDFRQGDITGSGYALYRDENGASVIEADKIVGRREIRTNEIKVNQVTFFGGKQIFSAAGINCSGVEDLGDEWKCYFDTKQGTVRNMFIVGDQAYHQTFDPTNSNVTNYFWRMVTEIGEDFIVISKSVGDGSGHPVAGNDIAQLGHPTDVTRQSAMEIDMTRQGGGLVTWFHKINTFNLNNKDSIAMGMIDGEVWAQVYGNAYIGERDKSTYLRHYNGVTEFKGRAEFTSGQAKEDIDKAMQDAEEAKNIQIGGVNLAFDSSFRVLNIYRYKSRNGYANLSIDTENKITLNNSLKITSLKEGSSGTGLQIDTMKPDRSGVYDIMISFYAKTDMVSTKMFWRWGFGQFATPITITKEWSKFSFPLNAVATHSYSLHPYFEGIGTVWMSDLMIEYGNKATSWSPAPQDVQNGINKAQNDATEALDKSNSTQSYIDGVLQDKLDELQDQIDGKVESFFYDYDPTLTNIPASEWTTTELKESHINDTFTNTHSGESWRWLKVDGVYKWVRISDSAALEALQMASKALDTADNKRRVFVVQPYPPYDKGDLWSQGANGGLLRCNMSRQTGNFVSSDWGKASNYTDDTLAAKAEADAKAANNAANNAQTSANNATNAVNNLGSYVDGAFKDGVITEAEAMSIASLINTVNESFASLDGSYNVLYANKYLVGTAKSNLKSKYDLVVVAKNSLITSINNAIADGKTTEEERDDVNSKYSVYNTRIKEYYSSVESANKSIQDKLDELSTNKVENIQIGGVNLAFDSSFRVLNIYRYKSRNGYANLSIDTENKITLNNSLKITSLKEGSSGTDLQIDTMKPDRSGVYDIMISFYAKTDMASTKMFWRWGFGQFVAPITITKEWSKFSFSLNAAASHSYSLHPYFEGIGTVWMSDLMIEYGNKATSWSPAPQDVQNEVDEVMSELSDIANDNKFTPDEKQRVAGEMAIIRSEKPKIDLQADKVGANKSAYNTAYNNLNNYITPLLADLNKTSDIIGSTFRNNFKNYYDAKVDLLKNISDILKNETDAKAQTFRTQPTTPYRVGDIWFNSSGKGGSYVCKTTRLSGAFNAADWVLAELYDNTKTVIDGGIVTSGTVRLAGDDANIKAGITGNGTADSSVRIWAGASEANKSSAPFLVRQDGSMESTRGLIGGFDIGKTQLVANGASSSEKVTIDSATQSVRINTTKSASGTGGAEQWNSSVLEFGANVGGLRAQDDSGAVSVVSTSGVFANNANQSGLPAVIGHTAKSAVVGLGYGSLSRDYDPIGRTEFNSISGVFGYAPNSASPQNAAPAYGGLFYSLCARGLIMGLRRITISGSIHDSDTYISCDNTTNIDISLPTSPMIGRCLYMRVNKSNLTLIGGRNSIIESWDTPITRITLVKGNMYILVFDGENWLCNHLT